VDELAQRHRPAMMMIVEGSNVWGRRTAGGGGGPPGSPQRMQPRVHLPEPAAAATLAAGVALFLVGVLAGVNPTAVIGAAAASVLVALALSDVTVGLLCFGVLAFFQNLPGVSGTVSAAKLAGAVVVLSWVATIAVRRTVRQGLAAAHPGLSYAVVVFLAWTVLSVAWAKSPGAVLTATSSWALILLLLPIVYAAIRTRRHALWLVGILVVGATLAALYGMLFARADALAQGTSRLAGAGLDANYLASLLVSGVVLATALASIRTLPPAARICAAGAAVVVLVALIDTVSRGGMFGLGAAMLAGILCAGRGRRLALLTVTAAIALWVVGYYATVASPAARARITSVQDRGAGRVDIWTVGWRMVEAHPITGVGAGNFPNTAIDYLFRPGALPFSAFIVDRPHVAHNMYLEVLADLGVVGLSLFLGIVGFLLSCAGRAAREFRRTGDRTMEIVSRALIVATAGILATDFFISDQFSKPLWIQLALCPCLLAIARRSAAPRDAR
jgi:putative inorganic carbon (HCO3(-)) transporter